MKKIGIIQAIIFAVIVFLEALPNGLLPYMFYHDINYMYNPLAVYQFFRDKFSYFNLIIYPNEYFSYALVWPFITAILSCILLTLSVVNIFKNGKKLSTSICIVTIIASFTLLLPIMFEQTCLSIVNFSILILFITEIVLYWLGNKRVMVMK